MGLTSDDDLLAVFDPKAQSLSVPALPLSSHVVRGPCEECNNGWMSRLEESVASCLRGIDADRVPLDAERFRLIASWLLKTFFVFGLRSDFFQTPIVAGELASRIVANPRQANDLCNGQLDRALASVSVGLGHHQRNWPVTAFGNCTTQPQQLMLFAGALVIGMPALDSQLWLVNPSLRATRATFPKGVTELGAGVDWRSRGPGAFPNPESVTVRFLE